VQAARYARAIGPWRRADERSRVLDELAHLDEVVNSQVLREQGQEGLVAPLFHDVVSPKGPTRPEAVPPSEVLLADHWEALEGARVVQGRCHTHQRVGQASEPCPLHEREVDLEPLGVAEELTRVRCVQPQIARVCDDPVERVDENQDVEV
jgi:hypothetical protein